MRSWPNNRAFLLGVSAALCTGACKDTAGPQYVESLRLTPETVYVIEGEQVSVDVQVLGPNQEPYPDRVTRVEWDIGDPSVAALEVLETGVMITGLKIGTTALNAELGRGAGTARVFVQPPGLHRVTIEPSPISIQHPGGLAVYARLWDINGNEMSHTPYHVEWLSSDENVGYVLYKDAIPTTFRSRRRGQMVLQVTVGGRTAQASVTIY